MTCSRILRDRFLAVLPDTAFYGGPPALGAGPNRDLRKRLREPLFYTPRSADPFRDGQVSLLVLR